MDFRILGPFEVAEGGRRVEVGATKPRALLAVLALRAGKVVSADVLVDALWGEDPPRTAASTLQTYVSQLRKALGADLIRTRAPGYVLDVAPDDVDAVRFEALLDAGRQAIVQGDPDTGARLLEEALGLWRGPALADFAFEPFAHLDIERLEELRLVATEELVDAELALGRHQQLVGRLRTLVESHPLRERLWGQLVTALYRCGRQAEALRALADVRRRLGDELGIEPGAALRQLEEDVLLQRPDLDVAPPATAQAEAPSNLPSSRSSFVGRDTELAELDKLLNQPGLVTVVGPGGVGKTRLALEVGGRIRRRFPEGVWLIELAALTDSTLVPHAVAEALDVREEPRRSLVDTLARCLAHRRVLLVLDNCEHLVDGVAAVADSLLRAAPSLTILATSREPLRVPGENVSFLAPLPLPSHDDLNPEALSGVDAVRLFTERAGAQASFSLTTENAPSVAALCRRLDGMPLAIELAAARVRTLTPAQMLPRLDDRFAFLTSGARTALPRHQTLRAAVDWSHDLLDEPERTVFRRLAVFPGSFSLDAVAAVCGDPEKADGGGVVERLAALVDHSLVVPVDADGDRRFRLLETVRAYAAERLAESGEEPVIQRRLLDWAVALVESLADALDPRRVTTRAPLERLESELDNLRQALRWGLSSDPTRALHLFAASGTFWTLRGYASESRHWTEVLLTGAPDAPARDRATLLRWAGKFAIDEGDMAAARPLLEQALELFRELGDEQDSAFAIANLAWIASDHTGDLELGTRLREEDVAICAKEGDHHLYCEALGWLAVNVLRQGDIARAQRLIDEALPYNIRHADDPCPVVFATAGFVALLQGDHQRARELIERVLADNREKGRTAHVPEELGRLGEAALLAGDLEQAFELFSEQLSLARELGLSLRTEEALQGLGRVAIRRGDAPSARSALSEAMRMAQARGRAIFYEDLEDAAGLLAVEGRLDQAARVLGAAEARRECLGTPMVPADVPAHERLVATIRARLDGRTFDALWTAGRNLSAQEALALASS